MTQNCRLKYGLSGAKKMEVDCSLCTRCENHCAFCFQLVMGGNVNEYITKDDIVKMADDTLELFMSPHAQEVDKIAFKIMGGEMFDRAPEDEIWDYYRLFFGRALENAKKANVTIEFNIVTNFLYPTRHLEAFFALVDEINNEYPNAIPAIGTSFDVWGRFHNPSRLDLWQKHFDMVLAFCQKRNIALSAETVLTRSTYNILRDKPAKYAKELAAFERLYKLCCDGLVSYDFIRFWKPIANHPELIKDKELAQVYIWLLQNYPELETTRNMLQKQGRVCAGGMDGWIVGALTPNCCGHYNVLALRDANPDTPIDELLKENTMATANLAEIANFDHVFTAYQKWNGCLLCKHFNYCMWDCMFHWNTKTSHEDPTSHYCWLKDVYDYIEKEGLFAATADS